MMCKRKYLFLDVDGVLNSFRTFELDEKKGVKFLDTWGQLDRRNLLCLKYFTSPTPNISIVLSSSWRGHELHERKLLAVFKEVGIPEWIDITPRISPYIGRGNEIQSWMDKHGVNKEDIVIFDDDCDMLHLNDRLVKTSFIFFLGGGLCYRHLKKAWEILEEKSG